MNITSKMQVEIFHLLFLGQFSSQTAANLYAVKGGCNLRFFFDSARYSEDLDIDVMTIQKQTLENKVNKILNSSQFAKLLQEYGINRITISTPKQTPTTQRWKIQLYLNSDMPLNTKIKFSRRSEKLFCELGNVTITVCQAYHLAPMRLSHYGINKALSQKVLALAHRSLTQSRDIFDLYHLLHIAPHIKSTVAKSTKEKAIEALLSIGFSEYRSQVVNFLEPEKKKIFDSKTYWHTITKSVHDYLNEL
jgi:predicted nucleotidyltransferase component of viral defense system